MRLRLLSNLVVAAWIALATTPAWAGQVTVFAAASLKTALEEIATNYSAQTGQKIVLSFAGTSALTRQIEHGAPADIFISANPGWMDHLEGKGLVVVGTRVDVVGNQLVLIGQGSVVNISPQLDLRSLLQDGYLAMALTEAVPAGIYGKAALETLGLWQGVAAQVAQADNVRAALALVAQGAAPLGIVYASDATAEPRVSVMGVFPKESHPPILYPAAVIHGRDSKAARAFLTHLQSDPAQEIFVAQGFADPEG